MELILLLARLSLALIFGLAGVAKLADQAGTQRALVDFGVPPKLAVLLRICLPVVELLVALALLPQATAWWAGLGALLLLVLFSGALAAQLARGHAPDCHCFGQLHSEPVSWATLARNVALAAVALLLVVSGRATPGLSVFNWLADLKAGEIVRAAFILVAVTLLAIVAVYLRRVFIQQITMLEKIEALRKIVEEDYADPAPVERADLTAPVEGLPLGAPAPDFSLISLAGEQMTLDGLLAQGQAVLLLFVSPNCAPCKTLLPQVRLWERDYDEQLTIALVSNGTLEENQKRLAKYGASRLLLQGESNLAEAYQSKWTPAAVLINPSGRIASPISYGDQAIRTLVTYTIEAAAAGSNGNGHRPHITVGNALFKLGDLAPRFALPDLNGKVVNAEDLLGGDTLLLFWDPGCPHCQAMTADLKRREMQARAGAPRLVIIASGDAAASQAQGHELSALVLEDPEFDTGPLFGTYSTPSAILIDAEGRIASSLAQGAQNILALLGVRKVALPIAVRN